MWITMLLQVFVSMLPAFTYQLWYDRPHHHPKSTERFACVISGASMVLCMLLTHHSKEGYHFDFRLIPFVVGSLYGGYRSMAALTVLYAASRLPLIETGGEWVSYILLLIIFCPLLLMSIRPFQFAKRRDKQKLGAVLVTILQLFFAAAMLVNVIAAAPRTVYSSVLMLLGMGAASYVVLWCSIAIIENMREKQLLHRQLRRMSDKYRAEVQKLQQFIDETPIGVVLSDANGRITHMNEASLTHFAGSSGRLGMHELRGRSYLELFDPTRDALCISMMGQALGGHRSSAELVEQEGRVLFKTAFTMHDNELAGHSAISGAGLIIHDISELRYLRDELGRMDRLSLVGQMAASITHEIRNPMAVIRGFMQLMRERSGGDSQNEYFRIIMEELDRANAIINDFLSLAQNRLIDKAFMSLNDIVAEMLPLIHADANLRGLIVEWQPQPDLPKLWLNDKEMKQLILNLARNGLEAMKDGVGTLYLSTETVPHENKVAFRVRDTGVGISQEQMDKLFEPFFTTKSRGTGLGLSVCLSIAEKHDGRIDVQSKEGEGTAFIVTFSLEGGWAGASAAASREEEQQG